MMETLEYVIVLLIHWCCLVQEVNMNPFGAFLRNVDGRTFFQYFSSISAMLAIVSSGVHYGWPSPSLPKLLSKDSHIPITENEGFWLATMPLFGALLGSLTAPVMVDNIGRKKTILLTSVPYLVSCIIIAFSWNVPLLYTARFIAGISDGWGFSSVPIYIGEISQPAIRGLLASGISCLFIFGILLINVVGSYLSIKMTAIVACALPIALLISFIWMPESPYFFIMKGRHEDAKRSLQTFIGPKLATSEWSRIDLAVKEDLSKSKSNPLDLFRLKKNYKPLLVVMLARGSQQLSGYSAIVFYTQNIFNEAGSLLSADMASIIYYSIQVVITAIAAGLVDKLGRRPLLLWSVLGSSVALLVEGTYFFLKHYNVVDTSTFSLIPIIALVFYIIFFSIGLENIPILLLSELFNQDVKAGALCFADIYFSVLAMTISKFFQFTRDSVGIYFPFMCFSIFTAIATILIYIFLPETKGRTLEEIQEHFRGPLNKTENVKIPN